MKKNNSFADSENAFAESEFKHERTDATPVDGESASVSPEIDDDVVMARRAAAERMRKELDQMDGSLSEMKAFFDAPSNNRRAGRALRFEKRADASPRRGGRLDHSARFAKNSGAMCDPREGFASPMSASKRCMTEFCLTENTSQSQSSDVLVEACAEASESAPNETMQTATVQTELPIRRIRELQESSVDELVRRCDEQNLSSIFSSVTSKHDLVVALVREALRRNEPVECDGYLDIWQDGGFLHTIRSGLRSCPEDVQIPQLTIQGLRLRAGDHIVCRVEAGAGRRFQASTVTSVNGVEPGKIGVRPPFTGFDAVAPSRSIEGTSYRFGDRVLLLRKDGSARTPMENLARTIATNNPSADVWLAILAAAPERTSALSGEKSFHCLTTDFEDFADKTLQMTGNLAEVARRGAELGRDTVILFDSITALVRSYGLSATTQQGFPTDGIDGRALARAHRLLGTGRALVNGGSVTVLAAVDDTPFNARILEDLRPGASQIVSL